LGPEQVKALLGEGLLDLEEAGLTEKDITERGDRVIAWTVSTEARDRDKDRILQRGWKLKNYRKNPVVLFGHDYGALPVGRSIRTWVDKSDQGSRLRMLKQFATREENEFADTVFNMAKAKFLRTASVGFVPLKFEEDPEAPDEMKEGFFRPMLFKENDLLESSVVPVPSNPEALQGAKSMGIDLAPYIGWAEEKAIEPLLDQLARLSSKRFYLIDVDDTIAAEDVDWGDVSTCTGDAHCGESTCETCKQFGYVETKENENESTPEPDEGDRPEVTAEDLQGAIQDLANERADHDAPEQSSDDDLIEIDVEELFDMIADAVDR
jgi:hypothetical protein